jgi:hypothetical protein
LHVLDGQHRDGVHVGAGVAAVARAKQVDQRGGVAALAVHQHQGLVRAEAAQGGGVDQVGAVGAGLAGRVERWGNVGQGLGQVELAAAFGGFVSGITSTGTVVSVAELVARREPTMLTDCTAVS